MVQVWSVGPESSWPSRGVAAEKGGEVYRRKACVRSPFIGVLVALDVEARGRDLRI